MRYYCDKLGFEREKIMPKTKIIVQDLCLELTRKCNLHCDHCMRGDSENFEMSEETMNRIFEDIDECIGLQFIGGEVSLAVDGLQKLIGVILKKCPNIHSVLYFTNGTNVSDELIECLNLLKNYCITINKKHDFDKKMVIKMIKQVLLEN